ncbi:MAG: hypothetical protein V7744_19340 [Pseudomonadales bacterium]
MGGLLVSGLPTFSIQRLASGVQWYYFSGTIARLMGISAAKELAQALRHTLAKSAEKPTKLNRDLIVPLK